MQFKVEILKIKNALRVLAILREKILYISRQRPQLILAVLTRALTKK